MSTRPLGWMGSHGAFRPGTKGKTEAARTSCLSGQAAAAFLQVLPPALAYAERTGPGAPPPWQGAL